MPVNTPLSDFELMQRVAGYDSKALEVLYDRYSPILYTVIKKIVTDEKTAGDILTGVFVIIWRKLDHFDFTTKNVYTWLVTLARNKAVDTLRRTREGENAEEYTDDYENMYIIPKLSPEIDSLDLSTAIGIKGNVEKALDELTDAQQYVIYLAYYEGLTENEIAARLNIPVQTVKSKIKIALSNLRENLLKGES
jgi:RNA polymerase sigma-70 factor (ECF subfamily)